MVDIQTNTIKVTKPISNAMNAITSMLTPSKLKILAIKASQTAHIDGLKPMKAIHHILGSHPQEVDVQGSACLVHKVLPQYQAEHPLWENYTA